MPAIGVDHNLLVGVLALQLDFVARDELIDAACEAGRGDSSQPLVDVLRRRGALSDDECDLLGALVNRHLARHDNDPQQSLAACDDAAPVQELLTALAGGAPETVALGAPSFDPHATRVAGPPLILPGDAAAGPKPVSSSDPTLAYSEFEAQRAAARTASNHGDPNAPLSTNAAERFRIIRPFQRGGLGQVSLARDAELNRDVALKEILPKHADSAEARQRFLMEAEITGSLEHPGVVPVYGLGQYADGRPFYAMRLIRGDNLLLALEEYHRQTGAADRELRFRQLLGRFVDVCNAIEYAHNRCVLHRDLKPGNIMLGKYGETLVVDWGLAKAIGADAGPTDTVELPVRPASADASTATQMGRVVGTPAYMSPEQAAGRVDMLGPATDVYSLGATLYHLLTGKAPFAFEDREALLGSVQMGRFTPPRTVRADVPKPLEAICLKAMARRPTDRYPSARGLADDVERYLADEPVAAYAEPLSARAWRWMRRHRAAVVGAGSVLTVIATSLAIGVVLLGAANRRAERNFEMARNAIRDYYITVSEDTLLDQPGMQPLRDQLLRQALDYYQRFLAEQQHGDAVRDELAQANFFVGRITEAIDSPAKALPFYEQAAKMNAALVAQSPNDEKRLYAHAQTLNALGGSLQKLQRLDESQRYYEQAETVRRKLVEQHPENVEYVRTLANTMMNRGSIDAARGNAKPAVERWQQAQQMRTTRLSTGDDDAKLRADAGKGDFNLGRFYLDQGDNDAARRHLTLAVEAFERTRQQAPDDLESQYLLAVSYRTLGDLQPTDAGLDAALALYDKAYELLAMLSLRNPTVPVYKSDLAAMQINVAEMLLAADNPADALDAIGKATGPLEEFIARNPADPDLSLYQRDLAVAWRLSGEAQLGAGDAAAAKADAQRSVSLLEQLAAASPADDDFREQLTLAKELQAKLAATR